MCIRDRDRGRELQGDENNDVGLEGDSHQGSSGSLEENSQDLEEAEEASFFYAKNEPSILMTEEMLESCLLYTSRCV